jgi:hypothetical protein
MTLTDPREALADQSDFIGYLVGLAGLAQVISTLADDGNKRGEDTRDPDDFVHVLLGLASVGATIEGYANSVMAQRTPTAEAPPPAPITRWLR